MDKQVVTVQPAFQKATHRLTGGHTDTDRGSHIERVLDVEPLPLEEVRANFKAVVETARDEILAETDTATIRPLRAVLAGAAVQADKDRIAALEAHAQATRDHAARKLAAIAAAETVEDVLAAAAAP